MIKAVLFDLDGTLANTLKDLADATNYALATQNLPQRETVEFKLFAGDGIKKMLERALPEQNRDNQTVLLTEKVFLKYYSVHYADNTTPYEGINELLAALAQMNIATAVVTNKAENMANAVIEKLYKGAFKKVFGKRDGMPAKPDPTVALSAMKALGVDPCECIFLGDSGVDVMTAVNSGAVPVGALWGFRSKDELIVSGAKYIIEKPLELIDIINEING